ncbi:MAG: glycosyltransferase family 2 protein [Geitlerinemataceae cyanobacterium]
MRANFWSARNASREFEPLSSVLGAPYDNTDLTEGMGDTPEKSLRERSSYRGYAGRRQKAAIVMAAIWGGTILLHSLSWGSQIVLSLTGLMGIQLLRLFLATPRAGGGTLPPDLPLQEFPYVSLLVAAKDEEAVIGQTIALLCDLDYPIDRYEVWAIDDCSTDNTPGVLDRLTRDYPNLRVLHRGAGSGGGKSGALNQALGLAQGEIVAVFDADAHVSRDVLMRVLPYFHRPEVGAVQMRKSISNANENFWTRGQAAEMALDSFFQQQRSWLGAVGELRGNGQFVRREALERCGYFNEETITDDLDLTLRLHLDGWEIDCITSPAVGEEGVTGAIALWHQRSRWAEGGYQRYLDYWRLIAQTRLRIGKKIDLLTFIVIQYLLPTAAVPDLLMAIARHRMPILSPATGLTVAFSFVGMSLGLRQIRTADSTRPRIWMTLWTSVQGTIYMFHWFAVIASTTARVSVRPKRLKWVKTVHRG